jgi:hypothetical protein
VPRDGHGACEMRHAECVCCWSCYRFRTLRSLLSSVQTWSNWGRNAQKQHGKMQAASDREHLICTFLLASLYKWGTKVREGTKMSNTSTKMSNTSTKMSNTSTKMSNQSTKMSNTSLGTSQLHTRKQVGSRVEACSSWSFTLNFA